MTTTIIKSSSGKKIALPAILIKSLGLEIDQPVEVKKWGNGLIIKPIDLEFDESRAQKATKKATENMLKGNVLAFNSIKDGIAYLES